MKLSVITINLNNKAGLQQTMNSILAQTCKEFEWIVVDGGSIDGSKELIEQYREHISWWCSEPDTGIYNAMNKGVRHSTGEYLLFLNSADYLFDKDVLYKVIPLLQGKDYYVGDEKRDNYYVRQQLSTIQQIVKIIATTCLPHQSTFINRRIFDTYGFYREDKKLVSDWWQFFNAIIIGDATIEKLPLITTVFDTNGISTNRLQEVLTEEQELLSELPRAKFLIDFYKNNYDIVCAVRATQWSFFLFRIYFWIYRNWIRK